MEYPCIVGIDVSSTKLDLCIQSAKGPSYSQIPYTIAALEEWLEIHSELKASETVVGLESTGDYHLKAAKFFLKQGYTVKIINPLVTRQYIRGTIRGTKTDRSDALLICKLVKDGHGETVQKADVSNHKKELLRISIAITQYTTQLKLRLQSTKRKELLKMAEAEKELQELIQKAEQISKNLVKQATSEQTPAEQYIDSIPGFAPKLAAIVMNEIGDIKRFTNPSSLVAYTGLDPRVHESGLNSKGRGRITKRGSPYLRCALYLAANIARQFDAELGAYYAKKKSEGRHHTEVLCIIARKLVFRIYAVLTQQRTYEKRPL